MLTGVTQYGSFRVFYGYARLRTQGGGQANPFPVKPEV